jgi:ABC-type antimicrobial peptide transport system permease subunit
MQEIREIAPFSIENIEASQQYVDQVLESRATQSVYGAYTLNVLFSLIYLTIGMTIVAMVRVRGLRRQISVIRALGANPNSIVAASLIETGVGMLFSAGVGSIIGVVLALIFMGLPLLYVGISTTSIWSRLPVLLQVPTLLVAAIVSVAVIVSLVATYFVLKRTLNLNIAEEIQYLE